MQTSLGKQKSVVILNPKSLKTHIYSDIGKDENAGRNSRVIILDTLDFGYSDKLIKRTKLYK